MYQLSTWTSFVNGSYQYSFLCGLDSVCIVLVTDWKTFLKSSYQIPCVNMYAMLVMVNEMYVQLAASNVSSLSHTSSPLSLNPQISDKDVCAYL